MKKIIVLFMLLVCFGFSAPTGVGGIAIQDVQVISSASDLLAEVCVTSRNAQTNAIVSTANYYGLSNSYSIWLFASQSATINAQLRTTGVTDGQIKIIATTGYSKPVNIITYVTNNITTATSTLRSYTVNGANTAKITFNAVGLAKVLMYKKSLGKYVVIGTMKTADIFTF